MFFDTIFGRNFGRVYLNNAILICHGFPYEGGSVIDKSYGDLAELFSRITPTIIFDFSGCGKSEGYFSIKDWVEDVKRISQKFERISLIGYSMGGLVAIRAGAELKNIENLVAISTPLPEIFDENRIKIMFENAVKIMRVGRFEDFVEKITPAYEMDPKKYIKRIFAPKLIVHGTRDEIVPFSSGEAIYNSATEPKTFFKVVDGDHFLRRNQKVMKLVADWLAGKIKDKELEIRI